MKLVNNKKYRIGIKKEYEHLFPYFSEYIGIDNCVRTYYGGSNDVTLEWVIKLHDIMNDTYKKTKRFVSTSLDDGFTREFQLECMYVFNTEGNVNYFFYTLLTNKSLHYLCNISQEE